MRLTALQREHVRLKYGGRCAYCGHPLPARWHADHMEPILRGLSQDGGPLYPHRDTIDNIVPACAPCNISKMSLPIERWREWLAGHIHSLNERNSVYRLVKAHRLIEETGRPVIFYFEQIAQEIEKR